MVKQGLVIAIKTPIQKMSPHSSCCSTAKMESHKAGISRLSALAVCVSV